MYIFLVLLILHFLLIYMTCSDMAMHISIHFLPYVIMSFILSSIRILRF